MGLLNLFRKIAELGVFRYSRQDQLMSLNGHERSVDQSPGTSESRLSSANPFRKSSRRWGPVDEWLGYPCASIRRSGASEPQVRVRRQARREKQNAAISGLADSSLGHSRVSGFPVGFFRSPSGRRRAPSHPDRGTRATGEEPIGGEQGRAPTLGRRCFGRPIADLGHWARKML